MSKKKSDGAVVVRIEVKPRSPRLAYQGCDAPWERPSPVESQVTEVVDPGHMTVFDGGRLLYAHPTRDGVIPCHQGEPLLEQIDGGQYQYTDRALELMTPERRRFVRQFGRVVR